MKLHHIVVLKDTEEGQSGAYTIDYSPLHQRKAVTLLQLFFGLNVPAEIRVRFLNSMFCNFCLCLQITRFLVVGTAVDQKTIIDNCEKSDVVILEQKRIAITPYRGVVKTLTGDMPAFSPAMEELLEDVTTKWRSRMNLYTHNCQHFSGFIRRLVKRP